MSIHMREGSGLVLLLAACLGAAVAFWLLPASINIIAWPSAGPARVAIFAPLFRLWLALAVAAIAAAVIFASSKDGAIRAARVRIVAPLALLWLWTLPYWPWLPDRAPVLLILGGPVRWLVAGAAVGGVLAAWIGSFRPRRTFPLFGRRAVLMASLAVYICLGLRSLTTAGLGGDEPHYLVITHSLLVDHDLKIENNHARRDYRAFWPGELRPDYLQRGVNGQIYSIHSPGLSVLVLPGYAIAGARGAVITMCLLGALAALAIYDIALLVGGRAVALLTWASICLTIPFVPHSWMLYPEIAGAAIVGWAIVWLMENGPRRTAWVWLWRGTCLGFLPWLHTKFALLLAALVALFLWRMRSRLKDAAVLLAPIGVSAVAWLAYFYVIYGSVDPQAAYGRAFMNTFIRSENIPRSLLGLLFDQKFGLLVYSPVYALLAAGTWVLLRDRARRGLAVALIVIAVPFVISSARLIMWWGGSSPPARFVVPLLPLLAAPMAAALISVRGRVGQATVTIAIALSLLIAAVGVAWPERFLLFSDPHGLARLFDAIQGSAPVTATLPTFTEDNWTTPLARAVPWMVAAAAALGLAWLVAARARRLGAFWIGVVEAVSFILVGSLLSPTVAASARAESAMRGRVELLTAYDPERLRGFTYATMTRADAPALLRAASLSILRAADDPVDAQGRVAGPPALPPGRYEARVWFQGQREHDGDLLVSTRRGNILARMSGPLANPATVTFDLPVQVGVFLSLSEPSTARAVQRVDITPLSIVPASVRINAQPRAVEAIASRPNAYIVYVDDESYPEGGVFWTRADNRAQILVAPAGASEIVLTLHVGPIHGTVSLTVDGQTRDVMLGPDETRQVSVSVREGAALVPILIRAPGWFRPATVDPKSADTRALGCQVRVDLR